MRPNSFLSSAFWAKEIPTIKKNIEEKNSFIFWGGNNSKNKKTAFRKKSERLLINGFNTDYP